MDRTPLSDILMKTIYVAPEHFPEEGHVTELPSEKGHYVRNVLRCRDGQQLELLDGRGHRAEVTILNAEDRAVTVRVDSREKSRAGESNCSITLYQAIPKGKRWRWLVEKCTELGIHRIVPLQTERTVVDISEDKMEDKLDRWRRVAGEALRQSGRSLLPEFTAQQPLEDAIGDRSLDLNIVAVARDSSRSISEVICRQKPLPKDSKIGIWIGPEGGFTRQELDLLVENGCATCHFGPRILRTETAAVTATSIMQYELGDLD
jgi:16S rRNA (uracil1498-N3)-methyltransferase